MAKPKTCFVCQDCGYRSAKWLGKCPDCGKWNALVEELTEPRPREQTGLSGGDPVPLPMIEGTGEPRTPTGIEELDRVLGGGVVAGSAILVGGDPGIGKSTIVLQSMDRLAEAVGPVLYDTGEESLGQIRMRAERLGASSEKLLVLCETNLERLLAAMDRCGARVVAVDSIQTLSTAELLGAPGGVGQVRECAARLVQEAKSSGRAVFLVGHVTKEGAVAGPKVLEHMVDTVLYFEGDRGHPYRILRATKNRYGSTNEIGVFEMGGRGLVGVADPSALFLEGRPRGVAGSVVACAVEGTRPLLVEIQALVARTSFSAPRRVALGVDAGRVNLLAAVLEKRAGVVLSDQDLYVNVAGGLRLDDPATDLAVTAAAASSALGRPLPADTVAVGEVGLAGEVRSVGQIEPRLAEAGKLGFSRVILPAGNAERLKERPPGLELVPVRNLAELLDKM